LIDSNRSQELYLVSIIIHLNYQSALFDAQGSNITLSYFIFIYKILNKAMADVDSKFKNIVIFQESVDFSSRSPFPDPSTVTTVSKKVLVLMERSNVINLLL